MFYQQVKLYDKENEAFLGGIAECEWNDDTETTFTVHRIICACCGSVFDADDFDEQDEDSIIRIVRFYPDWVDFSYAILDDED